MTSQSQTSSVLSSNTAPKVRFQIISDLHLDESNNYESFEIVPCAPYLALLGDIGNASDLRLYDFLEAQVKKFDVVFYVLGCHEAYNTTFKNAKEQVRKFADYIDRQRQYHRDIGRFVFLDRTRFDIDDTVTILGCTLYSRIAANRRGTVTKFVSDFSDIQDWTIDGHNTAHRTDLAWLNSRVVNIARDEPHRFLVVLTHFCPTTHPDALEEGSSEEAIQIQSANLTNLDDQFCWNSPQVKIWAFGRTHHCCDLRDEVSGKRVVSNQRGSAWNPVDGFETEKVVSLSLRGAVSPLASSLGVASSGQRGRSLGSRDSVPTSHASVNTSARTAGSEKDKKCIVQ